MCVCVRVCTVSMYHLGRTRSETAPHRTRGRRRVVGFVAVSLARTAMKRRTNLVFVDHLFVLPEWRNRGVGTALLAAAAGRCWCRSSPWPHLLGLVVRRHSAQQAAARRLYDRSLLRARRPRALTHHASGRPLVGDPLRGVEEYREGEARFVPSEFQSGDVDVTLTCTMSPVELVRDCKEVVTALRQHHARANGGDGADPVDLLLEAHAVVPAVVWS